MRSRTVRTGNLNGSPVSCENMVERICDDDGPATTQRDDGIQEKDDMPPGLTVWKRLMEQSIQDRAISGHINPYLL